MAPQDLAATVREVHEAWNVKDLDRCASYAHAGARMENVPFGASLGFREYIENWACAFPDGKIELINVVRPGRQCGRRVHRPRHAHRHVEGTDRRSAADRPPTGDGLRRELLSFRGEKLAEGRLYFDAFSFYTQLGIGALAQGRTATAAQTGEH